MTAPAHIKNNYEEVMPGYYLGVENEKYHSTDGVGHTNLCDIKDKSIDYYNMRKNSQEKPTDPLIRGGAVHSLTLTPDEYKRLYLVGPTINRNTKKWKEFILDHPHKIVIPPRMADDIHYMRDALYDNPYIKEILDSKTILREVSSWVTDPDTGILLRFRPDIIVDGIIYDLKSTIAPHVDAFRYSTKKYNYRVQDPFYVDCARLTGLKLTQRDDDGEDGPFKFLVVGSTPPWLTAVYKLPSEDVEFGRDKYRSALDYYAEYLASPDGWSGLSYGRETVTL
jgi:exodeoxyribonuclease VIII